VISTPQGCDAGWIGSSDVHMICALAGTETDAVAERFDPERYRALIRAALSGANAADLGAM